jgi:hypothetical protein
VQWRSRTAEKFIRERIFFNKVSMKKKKKSR